MITRELVASVLDHYKQLVTKGEMSQMVTHPLVSAQMVAACWESHTSIDSELRLAALQATVRWGVEQLRPVGTMNWMESRWRSYLTVRYGYLEPMKVDQLSDKMSVARGTIYNSRKRGIAELATTLERERLLLANIEGRRAELLAVILEGFDERARTLLKKIALYRHPIPLTQIKNLSQDSSLERRLQLRNLTSKRLLITDVDHTRFHLNPIFRPHLVVGNRREHLIASRYYKKANKHPYEVVYHLFMAGQVEESADYLLTHRKTIRAQAPTTQLVATLSAFDEAQIPREQRLKLKLVLGKVYDSFKDRQAAIGAYQLALTSNDRLTRAKAHTRLGECYRSTSFVNALDHFTAAITLLEGTTDPLAIIQLMETYNRRAWIYARFRWNPEQVEADLREVEQLLDESKAHLTQRAYWHNVWGRYYDYKKMYEQAREHRWQAWDTISQTEDELGRMIIAHNLGTSHAKLQEYEQAFERFLECRTLAEALNDHSRLMSAYQSLGSCHFVLDEYDEAIAAYERAYVLCEKLGMEATLGYIHYDLAEVSAKIGQFTRAKHHYDSSYHIATQMDVPDMITQCDKLLVVYPALADNITARQRTILEYVFRHGSISSRDCCELIQVSKRQAVRELRDELTNRLGILQMVGGGRSTGYILALSA